MSSPVPPPPAGSQPSPVPPSEDRNPYAADQQPGQPYSPDPTAQPYAAEQPGQAHPGAQQYGAPAQPYGTPGQPYAPAAQYGAPGQLPGAPRPSSGLAVAALVVGIVSFVLAWIPVVNIVSIVGGIAALILGILALRKASRGVAGGKGLAVAGTVLGGLSLVIAVVMSVFLGVAINDAIDSVESAGPAVAPSVEPAEAEETAGQEQPADAPAASGGILPLGETAAVGDYTVAVTGLNLEADDEIAGADATNPPAEGQYVIAELSVVYNGTEEGNPWMDLSYILQGADSTEYDDGTCMAIEPNSVVNVPALAAGESADYQVCLDVPAEAIDGATFGVEPFLSMDASERAVWEIR